MWKSFLQKQWPQEWDDFFNLTIFSFITILIWKIFFFFSISKQLLSIGDGPQYIIPYLIKLNAASGNFWELSYSPQWLGGSKPFIGMGNPFIAVLLSRLQIAPHIIYNCMQMGWQIGIGFFSYRGTIGLAELFLDFPYKKNLVISKPTKVFIFIVFSFMPYLGWQMAFGHILSVHLAFSALIALVICLLRKNLSFLFTVCVFFSLIEAFSSILYQYLLYGIVLGSIFILSLFCLQKYSKTKDESKENIFIPFCLFFLFILSAFIAAIPRGIDAVLHFLSSDASRSLHGKIQIFSYLESSAKDWLCSIPSSLNVCGLYKAPHLLQEVNFSIGISIIFLLFLPTKIKKYLLYPASITLIICIAISANIPVLSIIIIELIPFVEYFRVGARAFWFVQYFFLLLIIAYILYKNYLKQNVFSLQLNLIDRLVFLFCFLCLFFRTALLFELLCITILLINLLPFAKKDIEKYFLLAIATLSILAFKEREFNFPNFSTTWKNVSQLQQSILYKNPKLQFPLERIFLEFRDSKFLPNTAAVLELSTIEGYWQPQKRYSEIFSAFNEKEFSEQAINFRYPIQHESKKILSSFYNIQSEVYLDKKNIPQHTIYISERAPIWFPTKTKILPSYLELAKAAKNHFEEKELLTTLLLVENDQQVPFIHSDFPKLAHCRNRKPITVLAKKNIFSLNVELNAIEEPNNLPCIMVLSTNYSENILAYDAISKLPLKTFPAYGSLEGIIVPSSTKNVFIESFMVGEKYSLIGYILGIILFLIFQYFYFYPGNFSKIQLPPAKKKQ